MYDHDAVQNPLLTRSQAVSALDGMRDEHFDLLRHALEDATGLGPEDHLVVAALRRSLANIEGFLAMVEQRNIFCAMPLIRFQLDSAMRVFACTLLDDTTGFVSHLLRGESPGTFVRQKLHDGALKEELTKKHEHASDIYDYTSGYVHLSNRHLLGVLHLEQSRGEELVFTDYQRLPPWKEEDIGGALVQFVWATDVLLQVCGDWRERRRAQRPGAGPNLT